MELGIVAILCMVSACIGGDSPGGCIAIDGSVYEDVVSVSVVISDDILSVMVSGICYYSLISCF